jgi:tRNA A37 threonylcarbamoyladenosine synthetase subunit TsaC/SUA5/YrdC
MTAVRPRIIMVPWGARTGDVRWLDDVAARFARGEVGVMPTDTLYGLSGDASRVDVVERINAIKQRAQPATIIPHDLAWARTLVAPSHAALLPELWKRYPGDTLLLPYAHAPGEGPLPAALTSSGLVSLRGPQHWSLEMAARAGVPLVTTSANRTGHPPMTCVADLDPAVRALVDFVLDEGTLTGPPSALVHCNEDPPRRVART